MDLRTDRYHGLDREQASALALMVQGWPPVVGMVEVEHAAAVELADDLVRCNLLTRDPARGKSGDPVRLAYVDMKLHEWDSAEWPVIRLLHVRYMAIAYARAVAAYRFRSLEQTVQRVQRRKGSRLDLRLNDLAFIRNLTHIFRALRPFFYTAVDRCLFDSIVLVEFLALHSVFPTWVIGVKTMPFAAHSWVQVDRYVLNGPPSYVRAFVPILAV